MVPFDEGKYNQYYIINFPLSNGTYSELTTDDNALPKQTLDERVFLYQDGGQFYFYQQGKNLKKLAPEDMSKIISYIRKNKIDKQ